MISSVKHIVKPDELKQDKQALEELLGQLEAL